LLPERLTWIDETNRQTYFFLEDDDKCLFFGEFYPSKGWSGGPTNQFIKNFKRRPDEIAESAWPAQLQNHKNRAIREVAAWLRNQIRRELVETRLTFVPIPTSKVVDHPHHCDRLERTLRQAFHGFDADIRLLLRQTVTTEADHRSGGQRIKYDNLLAITEVDPAQLQTPVREKIVLFDDVLTSGKHYKVAKTRIREACHRHCNTDPLAAT
jgi:hypothetical protein